MPKPGKTGLVRIVHACGYSMNGLRAAWRHEAAFRQEAVLVLLLLPLALWLGTSGLERAVLAGSLFLVLIAELFNSGIEAVVDRVDNEWHELCGRAKDIASAAVFLALLNVTVTWALILLPRL